MALVIKASSRLESKVQAVSKTNTSLDSSFTTTASGVLAERCEKVPGLLQRWNMEGLTQECLYIFIKGEKWVDMSFTMRSTILS